MNFPLYVSLVFVLFNDCFVTCLFYPEELKPINYEVDISKNPIKIGEKQAPSVLSLDLISKYGQKYQCALPLIKETESEEKEIIVDENANIKELLKPLESGSCKIKTKGWWTYEFCPGRHIMQYHVGDENVLGQIISLGFYQSDYDWNNETNENKFQHGKQRYHSQFYANGTLCDLTGLPRSAEIRYFCIKDTADHIYHVDEPGTCTYLLIVHTSTICSHPKLKPLPLNKVHTISCKPLLNEQQFVQYLQRAEEEKSAAEGRNKLLANQQQEVKFVTPWEKSDEGVSSENFQGVGNTNSQNTVENLFLDKSEGKSQLRQNVETLKEAQSVDSNVEKNEDNLENILWKEYDEEVEKLKILVPPEKFSSLKEDIQKHINFIISEAEEELGLNLNGESKDAAFIKLASTLNLLLNKLEKAEKDVLEATKMFEKVQSVITSKSNVRMKLLEDEESKSAVFDDDKLHIRIRRLERKSTDSHGELHEMDFTQRKQLEQAVKESLEKSGLDTGGRRIEVKIITVGYYDNEDGKDFHSLSDDETNQFQNMIMALLTGQQEAIQEMERYKKLEENYKFVWNNKQLMMDDDDDE